MTTRNRTNLFSQSIGIRPLEKAVQHDSIDLELRSRIWNVLKKSLWDQSDPELFGYLGKSYYVVDDLCVQIWDGYFKLTSIKSGTTGYEG